MSAALLSRPAAAYDRFAGVLGDGRGARPTGTVSFMPVLLVDVDARADRVRAARLDWTGCLQGELRERVALPDSDTPAAGLAARWVDAHVIAPLTAALPSGPGTGTGPVRRVRFAWFLTVTLSAGAVTGLDCDFSDSCVNDESPGAATACAWADEVAVPALTGALAASARRCPPRDATPR